jgi:hypothetical protein
MEVGIIPLSKIHMARKRLDYLSSWKNSEGCDADNGCGRLYLGSDIQQVIDDGIPILVQIFIDYLVRTECICFYVAQ